MKITVAPAYGRDYPTAQAAIAAWQAGYDFINASRAFTGGGTYISIRDMGNLDAEVWIRYKKLTEIVEVK